MKKLLVSIVSLGLLSVGFMFGTVVTNGKHVEVEQSYQNKIDSLDSVIEYKEFQIESLEESCQDKEAEISYWGRLYDECKY